MSSTPDQRLRQTLDAAAQATSPAMALHLIDAALADDVLAEAAVLHNARAKLLLQLGRVDDAVDAGARAMALEPGVPDLATNLGAALLARFRKTKHAADLDAAVTALQEAVVVGPKTAEVRSTLVVALLQSGRLDDALLVADDNLAIFADDEVTAFNRAAVLQALGRIDDARAALTALATTFPPAKDALLRLHAPRR